MRRENIPARNGALSGRRWAAVVTGLALTGCMSHHGVRMHPVDPTGWSADDRVAVRYRNEDTLGRVRLSIPLRWRRDFTQQAEFGVSVTTFTPEGIGVTEWIRIDPGRLPAAVGGRAVEAVLPYRRNAVLNERGVYRFEFVPDREVEGVEAIGIDIEREDGER